MLTKPEYKKGLVYAMRSNGPHLQVSSGFAFERSHYVDNLLGGFYFGALSPIIFNSFLSSHLNDIKA